MNKAERIGRNCQLVNGVICKYTKKIKKRLEKHFQVDVLEGSSICSSNCLQKMHRTDVEVRFLPVYIGIAVRNDELSPLSEDHVCHEK